MLYGTTKLIIFFIPAEMAAAAGPKRTRQTYTRYQTLELEKVGQVSAHT